MATQLGAFQSRVGACFPFPPQSAALRAGPWESAAGPVPAPCRPPRSAPRPRRAGGQAQPRAAPGPPGIRAQPTWLPQRPESGGPAPAPVPFHPAPLPRLPVRGSRVCARWRSPKEPPPRTHRGGHGAELGAQQQPEAQPEPHAAAHRTAPSVPGRRGAGDSQWGSAGPAPHARLFPPSRTRRLQCLGGEGLDSSYTMGGGSPPSPPLRAGTLGGRNLARSRSPLAAVLPPPGPRRGCEVGRGGRGRSWEARRFPAASPPHTAAAARHGTARYGSAAVRSGRGAGGGRGRGRAGGSARLGPSGSAPAGGCAPGGRGSGAAGQPCLPPDRSPARPGRRGRSLPRQRRRRARRPPAGGAALRAGSSLPCRGGRLAGGSPEPSPRPGKERKWTSRSFPVHVLSFVSK